MDKKYLKAIFYAILILLSFNLLNWYSTSIFINEEIIKLENTEGNIQKWVQTITAEGVFLGRVPKVGSSDEYYIYFNKENNTYLDRNQYWMTNINRGFRVRFYNDTVTDNVDGLIYKLTPNKKINFILVKDENNQEKIAVSKIPVLQKLPFYERAKVFALSFLKVLVLATPLAFFFIKSGE